MPKKTLQQVLDSGNDYLVCVKANQKQLYKHVQTFERYLEQLAKHIHNTHARGRREYREVKVYSPNHLEEQGWIGVRSIVCVERWGRRKEKDYRHKMFYLSSLLTSASNWQSIIRGHWGIENRLHWPKDKVFGEDDYRLEDEQALLNWSIFRSIGINLLRLNGFQSLKSALTELANRVDVIFSLLT